MTEQENSAESTLAEQERPADPRLGSAAGGALLAGIWELVQVVALALVLVIAIRNFVQNYRIEGQSMEPNFHDSQFLLINRWAYCPGIHLELPVVNLTIFETTWCARLPQRGDVIIFEYPREPSKKFIKRVIGLPGETVEIRTGKVHVNGQPVPEPFGPNPGSYSADPIVVGPDEVYVMGDNRNNSSDSHLWGPLPLERIVGRAMVSYWPPKHWSVVPGFDLTDLSVYVE